MDTRNILLIGRTGGGKSTLGNVLVNKNDNFEEVFEESAGTASKTRSVEESIFEVNLSKELMTIKVNPSSWKKNYQKKSKRLKSRKINFKVISEPPKLNSKSI